MIGLMLLAVFSGMALSMQAAINSQLGKKVGMLNTALVTFGFGLIINLVLIFLFEGHHEVSLLAVPKWQLLGSLFGIVYILMMVVAVPRIGVAIATVTIIFGQMSMSLLIDTLGWLGNRPIAFNYWRLLAIMCIALALVSIYLSNKPQQSSKVQVE